MLKRWMEKLERIWIAVTFAEAGEHDTARRWAEDPKQRPASPRADDAAERHPPRELTAH